MVIRQLITQAYSFYFHMDNSSLLQAHSMSIVIIEFIYRSSTQQYGLILKMLYSMFPHTNQKLL